MASAKFAKIIYLNFESPRNRAEVLDHEHYYDFRFALISFLEKQEHSKEEHVKAIQEKLRTEAEAELPQAVPV